MHRARSSKQNSEATESAILQCAAKVILQTGQRELDIQNLSRETGVPRTTIYTVFGGDSDVKETIFLRILTNFLSESATFIGGALATVDPRADTPVERLAAVFRATLAAFRANALFGKVVLAQLNLRRKSEAEPVFQIFKQVDRIIADARESGQLAQEPAKRLVDWKIRQVMFVLAHGLLCAMYLGEGLPPAERDRRNPTGAFSDKDVEIEVLRVLQIYCSRDAAEKLQKIIEAIKGAKDG